MKELSIEEKAKRYDEAIIRAKSLIGDTIIEESGQHIAEVIFPELKESEDEKVEMAIFGMVYDSDDELWSSYDVSKSDVLDWLQKQSNKNKIDYDEELKKCKANPLYFFDKYVKVKLKKQKSTWSEEDEEIYQSIIDDTVQENQLDSKQINWLKSLKDRVHPQNSAYYNPYKEVVESIAEMCKHYDKASHSGLRDFYDNVKVKCKDAKEYDSLFPQNTWKPSDEQINALEYYIYSNSPTATITKGTIYGNLIVELLEQLKKLREERIKL